MRAAVEPYPSHSSQTTMMRDYNVIMTDVDLFDEQSVLQQLNDESFSGRSTILERLRTAVRMHSCLPFQNTIGLFQGLERTLSDTNWDVRRQCALLISDYIPLLRIEVDACMGLVLPQLIAAIGESRIVIRRGAIQTIHLYMKYTNDMPLLLRYYVQYGLEHSDNRVRKEAIIALPLLVTEDFASEDFSDLIISLCKKLVDRNEQETIQQSVVLVLKQLRGRTGDTKFRAYLMKLQPQLRDYYCQLEDFPLEQERPPVSPSQQFYDRNQRSAPVSDLYYGIVPSQVMTQLTDDNFRNRSQAVEQLKHIMDNLPSIAPLMPHVKEFLAMLNGLLDDNNFRIITVTLDIIGILVEKTSQEIRPHLKPVLAILTKRMGDNKNVIRQAITKVVMQLMQILGPKLVLLMLNDNLSHRSPRVRTEAINCVINSLLTFPSYEFDLEGLCTSMAYCLLDSKRTVRHACLECFAVLAQCLGAGKLHPLMSSVKDSVEKICASDCDIVMAAVQARLTRRMLPRRNEDNLIDYAVTLPSLNSSRNGTLGQQGADVDWILAGAGAGGSSARSMRLEDLESSSRQSSASLDGRRHLNSGKKSKLPWDESQPPKGSESPVKSKQTWADEPQSDGSKKLGKHSKPREDLLLASMSYNVSPETSTVDSAILTASSNGTTPTSTASSSVKPPFSKSSKSGKQEATTGSKSLSGKPILNPLPVGENGMAQAANTWAYDPSTTPTREPPPSNIPVKASPMPRNPPAKKPGKVPPIPKSHSPLTIEDEIAVDNNGNELPQLNASLNKIRSSASKKKAEKLFDKLEKQESETQFNLSSSTSNRFMGALDVDNPFEARPKLARHNSHTKSKSYSELAAERMPGVQPLSQSKTADIQPAKSESLSNKIRQSLSKSSSNVSAGGSGGPSLVDRDEMVAIVGRGYSDDSVVTPPKLAPSSKNKRRTTKPGTGSTGTGSSLSPLGLAATSAPGMIPIDDDGDLVSVIGKGMFEGEGGKSRNGFSNAAGSKSERSNSISKSSSGYGTLHNEVSDLGVDSDEEVDSLQMSMGLRAVAAKKKKERQDEAEAKRLAQQAKEKAQRAEEEEKRRLEQERAAERKRKQQETAERRKKELEQRKREEMNAELDTGLQISGSSSIKPAAAAPEGRTKARSPVLSAAASIPSDESLRPFSRPSLAFKDAMRLLGDDGWSNKTDGVNKIRRLAMFHSDVLQGSLHAVTLAVLAEVKNLRSQVARLAIVGLGDLFTTFKKLMDAEVEGCSKTLLHKNGEANEFIRTELDRTLGAMVTETTPQRCLTAVIAGGAHHKNAAVRKVAVQHIATLCEKLGPGRLLSGVKDLTDKVLHAVTSLCRDPSPESRWFAKKVLLMLVQHPDFESMLHKHSSAKDAGEVLKIADTLRQKGLGEMPSDTPSAKGPRRGTTFNRSSRTNSAESTDSVASSIKSRRSYTGPQAAEDAAPLLEHMGSSNWSTRYESVTELADMVGTKSRVVAAQSVKIFDKYAMLIKDSNSKVALYALDTLAIILPQVKQQITGTSINLLIQGAALGLASKNRELYDKASNLLDSFINNIDHHILFQPFVQVAMNSTAKTKPDIVDRVSYLSKKVYKVKQKAVILHALPLAWSLVKSISTTGSSPLLKGAITDFLAQLYELMGDSLFDHAASAPGSNPQLVDQIKEMCRARNP